MSAVATLVHAVRRQARAHRADVFRAAFRLGPTTKILDLGSEDGSAIASVIAGTGVSPQHVYIADLDAARVEEGERRYGFVPVVVPEDGRLPFEDGYFDIVYCSSVIEHVTVAKTDVWTLTCGRTFRERARAHQREFAREIRRLGRGYYVQTPNKWFPVESHTWLPFVGFMPRSWQVPLIRWTNRYWVKRTSPDWHLLTAAELCALFPDAQVHRERLLGMTKSLMAIKTPDASAPAGAT